MTKIRVLHIPTGIYHEISFEYLVDECCQIVNCPKEIDDGDCDKCPWAASNLVNELEYDMEIIND